jgi:hypothetical protein
VVSLEIWVMGHRWTSLREMNQKAPIDADQSRANGGNPLSRMRYEQSVWNAPDSSAVDASLRYQINCVVILATVD